MLSSVMNLFKFTIQEGRLDKIITEHLRTCDLLHYNIPIINNQNY